MRSSPRIRRLHNDRKAIDALCGESTIVAAEATGDPADRYLVRFHGRGLWRPKSSAGVLVRESHEVRIILGASYPRMMPELHWVTPIFHPNISASGVVCLGGYGTHWVPSLGLDELCEMLWDMIRYQNFDVESPYNREAALWAKSQTAFALPLDARPIRNLVARGMTAGGAEPASSVQASGAAACVQPTVMILDDGDEEIIDAELVDTQNEAEDQDQDIVFLD